MKYFQQSNYLDFTQNVGKTCGATTHRRGLYSPTFKSRESAKSSQLAGTFMPSRPEIAKRNMFQYTLDELLMLETRQHRTGFLIRVWLLERCVPRVNVSLLFGFRDMLSRSTYSQWGLIKFSLGVKTNNRFYLECRQ